MPSATSRRTPSTTLVCPPRRWPPVGGVLEDDWRRIDRELSAYLALPAFGGERALYDSTIPSALRSLDEAVSRLAGAVEAGDPGKARTMADREVGPAAKEAAKRLRAMVRINSTDGYAAVEELGGKHRDFARLHLVFDALAVAVGIGLALLLSLQFRAHGRLAREHSALVERQVSELEVFAQRVAHDLLSPLSALTYCLGAFKRSAESDPKLQDALTRARGCVARARRMVDAIFDFARAGGRPQPGARVELRDALDEATEALREVSAGDAPEVTVEPYMRGEGVTQPGLGLGLATVKRLVHRAWRRGRGAIDDRPRLGVMVHPAHGRGDRSGRAPPAPRVGEPHPLAPPVVEVRVRDAMGAELLPQVLARDTEQLRGLRPLAARDRERPEQVLALGLLHDDGEGAQRAAVGRGARRHDADVVRQVLAVDGAPLRQDDGVLHGVRELAHVAEEGVGGEGLPRADGDVGQLRPPGAGTHAESG